MNKLISMTEFILNQNRAGMIYLTAMDAVIKYANFLSQPLSIEMFVPCKLVNGVWVVLQNPGIQFSYMPDPEHEKRVKEFQEAKERCLFEGFEYNFKKEWFSAGTMILDEEFINNKIIEDLVKYNLTLTPTAKKQLS